MAGEGTDDTRPGNRVRILLGEHVRFVRQTAAVGAERAHSLETDRRIALAVAEDVSSARSGDEVRDIRIAAAPHPGVLPDRAGEGERSPRHRHELIAQFVRKLESALAVIVNLAQAL